jgi:pilin isopeptide linkage protein
MDLMAGDEDLAIDDVMGEGMSMASSHTDCFKVYKVTGSDQFTAEEAKASGEEITKQCSWSDITTDSSEPTYRFTVPDATHVVIVYWATFAGVPGQTVSASNVANFSYEGKDYSNNDSKWSNAVRILSAGADAYTHPYFYLQKQDQWGNNVSGAVFAVYEYNSATGKYDKEVLEKTTTDGVAYIGHNSSDSFADLKMGTIYRIQEISSPIGYTLDNTEHYFEFLDLSQGGTVDVTDQMIADHPASHPTDINVVDISPGGTYTVTNTFNGASCQIPVKKTINGSSISSTVAFTFNLKKESGAAVYTDDDYKVAMPNSGINATITGSGTTDFTTLYFKSAGTYVFTMTENDLSQTASDRGYSKDDATYTVTVVIAENASTHSIAVESVTYSSTKYGNGDITSGDVPTFDNALSLVGSVDLQVKKTVSGRTTPVKAGEFSFTVTDNSTGQTIKDSDGNDLVFTTQEGGLVDITIPLSHSDIGTKRYIIREVVPADADKNASIGYTASPVIAKVTVTEVTAAESSTGKAGVAATSISYTADKKEDGVPLMVNEYHATGEVQLEGKKVLTQKKTGNELSVEKGQFTFTVKEGNTTVATGTTEADGTITFDKITYVQSDVGEHTYTITEDTGDNSFVEYSNESYSVKVLVTDQGDGTLATTVDYSGVEVVFHNTYSLVVPTGIRLDILPYLLVLVLAGCAGILPLLRRKKHRGNVD